MKTKNLDNRKNPKLPEKGKGPENKNVLDSRKNQEYDTKHGKVTHNHKETTKQK